MLGLELTGSPREIDVYIKAATRRLGGPKHRARHPFAVLDVGPPDGGQFAHYFLGWDGRQLVIHIRHGRDWETHPFGHVPIAIRILAAGQLYATQGQDMLPDAVSPEEFEEARALLGDVGDAY